MVCSNRILTAPDTSWQHDGYIVPAEVCNQSNSLLCLLGAKGDVTLPIQASHFQTWLTFASDISADICATCDAASLAANARAIEVQPPSTTGRAYRLVPYICIA